MAGRHWRDLVRHHPDVVVLDILMPVVTGLEALEYIRQRQAHTPVILFTAYDEDCLRDDRGAERVKRFETTAERN